MIRKKTQLYLKILGFATSAKPTIAEVRTAYKKEALKWHPDKNPDPDAKGVFSQLTNAMEFLKENPPNVVVVEDVVEMPDLPPLRACPKLLSEEEIAVTAHPNTSTPLWVCSDCDSAENVCCRAVRAMYQMCMCGHALEDHGQGMVCKRRGCECGRFSLHVQKDGFQVRCKCRHKHTDHNPSSHAHECTRALCKSVRMPEGSTQEWVVNCKREAKKDSMSVREREQQRRQRQKQRQQAKKARRADWEQREAYKRYVEKKSVEREMKKRARARERAAAGRARKGSQNSSAEEALKGVENMLDRLSKMEEGAQMPSRVDIDAFIRGIKKPNTKPETLQSKRKPPRHPRPAPSKSFTFERTRSRATPPRRPRSQSRSQRKTGGTPNTVRTPDRNRTRRAGSSMRRARSTGGLRHRARMPLDSKM